MGQLHLQIDNPVRHDATSATTGERSQP
jgi:hypothetical protein